MSKLKSFWKHSPKQLPQKMPVFQNSRVQGKPRPVTSPASIPTATSPAKLSPRLQQPRVPKGRARRVRARRCRRKRHRHSVAVELLRFERRSMGERTMNRPWKIKKTWWTWWKYVEIKHPKKGGKWREWRKASDESPYPYHIENIFKTLLVCTPSHEYIQHIPISWGSLILDMIWYEAYLYT